LGSDRSQESPNLSLKEDNDGNDGVIDEILDKPVGSSQSSPACDKEEKADNSNPDGHLIGFCVLDQPEEGIEDERDEKNIQEVTEREALKRIDDVS
jgi:hypothetical protein